MTSAPALFTCSSRERDEERRIILRAIGPVWDGNEVWLLAAGGTLYFAFPLLYASSFSGFYLPLMMVLVAADAARPSASNSAAHLEATFWKSFFDVIFSDSRVSCWRFFSARRWATWFAACRSNADGYFFEPLWTNWRVGGRTASSTGTR